MFTTKPGVSPAKALPIFGMKPQTLSAKNLNSPIDLVFQLTEDYHRAILRATIIAAGSEVIDIPDLKEANEDTIKNFKFVRDPVFTLADKRVMLHTEGNQRYGSMNVLAALKEKMCYETIQVKDAYFEGGNIFYCPQKQIVLHGLNPVGHYPNGYDNAVNPNCLQYKKEPAHTTKQLATTLSPYGISVHGLELNPDLITHKDGVVFVRNYYHLDCFMQVLPDGRIVILNKEILSKESQAKMKELFGDDFIDLGYPDYKDKPVLLNFIAIENNNNTTLISPNLPEAVLNGLRKLNLTVVTPYTLDSKKPAYDKEFSARVASVLQKQGYETADATNLATHVPKNENGYISDDGKAIPKEIRDQARGADFEPLDEYYSEWEEISFEQGQGGPHCLVADVMPCVTIRPALEKTATEQEQQNIQVKVQIRSLIESRVAFDYYQPPAAAGIPTVKSADPEILNLLLRGNK